MDPTQIVTCIFDIIELIRVAVETAKANNQQCKRLAARIEAITDPLRKLKKVSDETQRMLEALLSCIQECEIFVTTFSEQHWFKKIFYHGSDSEGFQELNLRLSNCAQDLNLGLNIEQVFDKKNDEQDKQSDLASINQKLDDIASQMAKEQKEQFQQQKQDLDELLQYRLASFRHSLEMTLLKGSNDQRAKEVIAEEKKFLHIASADLYLEAKIGSGGFADVRVGKWLSRDQEVAVKTIRIHHLYGDEIRNRFVKEISLMYGIHYEHIVGLIGACLEPNYYALILEYMPLGSLHNVLVGTQKLSLPWSDRWSLALQATKGINYLHQLRPAVIHRDIKSMNFLVSEGRDRFIVKVSDFGLAEIRNETSRQSKMTQSVGTISWKAPELLSLKGRHSTKTDVYALGIVFWEIATRCTPYEDNYDEDVIRTSVKDGERLDIPNDVPNEFKLLITRSWAQNSDDRPTCLELITMITSAPTASLNTKDSSKLA